jgi:hypothetical protein
VVVIATIAFALKESGIVHSFMEVGCVRACEQREPFTSSSRMLNTPQRPVQKMVPKNEKKVDQTTMANMYERLLASTLGYAFFHPFAVVSEVMTINGAE